MKNLLAFAILSMCVVVYSLDSQIRREIKLINLSSSSLGNITIIGGDAIGGGFSTYKVLGQYILIKCKTGRRVLYKHKVDALGVGVDWYEIQNDPTKYITFYPDSIRAKLAYLTVNIDTTKLKKCHWWTLF